MYRIEHDNGQVNMYVALSTSLREVSTLKNVSKRTQRDAEVISGATLRLLLNYAIRLSWIYGATESHKTFIKDIWEPFISQRDVSEIYYSPIWCQNLVLQLLYPGSTSFRAWFTGLLMLCIYLLNFDNQKEHWSATVTSGLRLAILQFYKTDIFCMLVALMRPWWKILDFGFEETSMNSELESFRWRRSYCWGQYHTGDQDEWWLNSHVVFNKWGWFPGMDFVRYPELLLFLLLHPLTDYFKSIAGFLRVRTATDGYITDIRLFAI